MEFPDLGTQISWIVQLDLLHHCVKLRFSNAQCCQALKRRSGFHSVVTSLSHQSRRVFPRDWFASKVAVHEDCDLVNTFLSALLWAFPPDTALHVSTGYRRIHEARSFSGLDVSAKSNCRGPSTKFSHKQICIVLLHLSSESDSVFRLTPVFPLVSRGVLTALEFVLHPDSLMKSGACLKSSSISRYTPTRNPRFYRRLFTSESSHPSVPMFFAVYLDLRRVSICLSPSSSDKNTEKSIDMFESIVI